MSVALPEIPSEAQAEILLDARDLCRRLGRTGGVSDISLSLARGDVLGLLGLNGAGKSTTLRLLAGALAPDSGSVSIAGHSMSDAPLEARAHLGYLPDTPPLYPELRVQPYLRLSARLRRLTGTDCEQAVERVIERCDLADIARRRIGTLSKGYRQRVGLAQAIIHDPEVLLLDEPGSGLDPRQTEELRRLVSEIGRAHCVLFSTHLLHEAQSVCNRIAVVHAGRLLAERVADGEELDALFTDLARGEPGAAAG